VGVRRRARLVVFYKLKSAQFIIEKVPTLKKERLKLLFKSDHFIIEKQPIFIFRKERVIKSRSLNEG